MNTFEAEAAIAEIKEMADKVKGKSGSPQEEELFDATTAFMFGKAVPSVAEMSAAGIHFPSLEERMLERNQKEFEEQPDKEERKWIAQFRRDYSL